MRKDLVAEVLGAAEEELFEDVIYTPVGGSPVTVLGAIFGVEVAAERIDMLGNALRVGTHWTRALWAKFPDLRKGDVIDDGSPYQVLDWEPVGDGRFEIAISLKAI